LVKARKKRIRPSSYFKYGIYKGNLKEKEGRNGN
jgi:hypothetical protein